MQKQLLWAVVIVVVLGGAYWWWQGNATSVVPESEIIDESDATTNGTNNGAMMEDGSVAETTSGSPMSATVSYSGASFMPAKITIKKGGTITWTNTGDTSMWVASAQHPSHIVYDGTNLQEHCASGANDAFDQCKGGDSYSFTFEKVGTWNYHDHLHASVFGSVEVVE